MKEDADVWSVYRRLSARYEERAAPDEVEDDYLQIQKGTLVIYVPFSSSVDISSVACCLLPHGIRQSMDGAREERGMRNFNWIDRLPGGTVEGTASVANRLYWNITWQKEGDLWVIRSGEGAVMSTDSYEVVEAFLYGMGLAYVDLPPGSFENLVREAKEAWAPEDL